MGEMILVECPTCANFEEEFVGFGMMGKGTALVVCEKCSRFVRKRLDAFSDGHTDPPYFCPYCRGRTIEVDVSAVEPAPCPNCGSPLIVTSRGVWD